METDHNLPSTGGYDAMYESSVTRFLCAAKFLSLNLAALFAEQKLRSHDLNEAVLLALTEEPFGSIYQLSQLTYLSRTTDYRSLTQFLGFHGRHFRSTRRRLSRSEMSNRLQLSRRLLPMLEIH
jgi:hypothetical protein